MSRHTIAAAAALVIALAACAGDADEPAAEPDPPPEETDEPDLGEEPDDAPDDGAPDDGDPALEPDDRIEPDDPGAPGDTGDATALLDDQVQLAIDDAVDRTGADRDEIQVVTTELVTWADGSLGCPDPDQMYTMALVDGYRIVLEVDGTELDYHGAEGSPPSYCAQPQPPAEGGAPTS